MNIPRFALLNSTAPFVLRGIGSLKSPTLKDISPNNMENYSMYALATQVLFGDKKDVIFLGKGLGNNNTYDELTDYDIEVISKFNLIINSIDLRDALCQAFALFFCNKIGYSVQTESFWVFEIIDEKSVQVGVINNDNYLLVEDLLKQLLHCESEYDDEDVEYENEATKALWERAEAYEKNNKQSINSENYAIDNIISKLCTCGIGYTVSNIYDLTVYQLYDQFSSYIQNRISQLSENAYAHNGGENFDVMGWLKNN